MPESTLRTVTATWDTPYSDETWRRLEQAKSDTQLEVENDDDIAVIMLGLALPADAETRMARAVVHRHLGGDEQGKQDLHWTLSVRAVPGSTPPPEVMTDNEKVGGRRGLAKLLSDSIPSGTPSIAFFRVNMQLDRKRYTCKVLPVDLKRDGQHDASLTLGRSVSLEQVGYRFESGVNGLDEVVIIYMHKPDTFYVDIRASGLLKLTADTWLPFADEVADLVLNTFFLSRGDGE